MCYERGHGHIVPMLSRCCDRFLSPFFCCSCVIICVPDHPLKISDDLFAVNSGQ